MDGTAVPTASASRRREQRSWYWYDWATAVFWTSVVTVFLSLYLTSVAQRAAEADVAHNGPHPCPGGDTLHACDITLLGLTFPAGSLWGYLVSAATAVQVLVLPLAGAFADHTQNKRTMLAVFAAAGAASTSLLALVAGTDWQLGVALFIFANICYGASIVVYYAFLPEIALPDERDRVSSIGWSYGYLGGGLALALHLAVYLEHDALGLDEAQTVRWIFFSAGLWWAVFTVIPVLGLRRHQAPQGDERGTALVAAGFRQLRQTLRQARLFPLTLGFLVAYLIYADGINTVISVSAQYGHLELKLPQQTLIVTILIVQFIAFVGAVAHGRLAAYIGAKKTIMVSLVIWVVVLGGAYFVAAGEPIQFYAVAAGIGLVLGGTNALSRSLFSQMVPPGKEAEYFSLYEVGERATSWLGPLLFAGVGQATGSFRTAIISLVVFFVVGLVLVTLVPARRAIDAVGNTAPEVI